MDKSYYNNIIYTYYNFHLTQSSAFYTHPSHHITLNYIPPLLFRPSSSPSFDIHSKKIIVFFIQLLFLGIYYYICMYMYNRDRPEYFLEYITYKILYFKYKIHKYTSIYKLN